MRRLILILLASGLLLAACGAVRSYLGTAWNGDYTTATTTLPLLPDSTLKVSFHGDHMLSMYAGCNSGGGQYMISEGRLTFDPNASVLYSWSQVTCGNERDSQDEAIATFFEANPTMTVNGDTIELANDSHNLVLVKE